jgi:hypothetical protein
MNKKKSLMIIGKSVIIIGVIVVVVALCICFGGKNNDISNPEEPTTSTVDDAQLQKEYEELKERVKDIYNYVPVAPYSFEVDGEKHQVTDLTNFFTIFPSKTISNKKGNEILYQEELYEVKNNVDDFNESIFTEKEVKDYFDNEGVYPEKRKYFDIEIPGYNYQKTDEYQHSFYDYTMYENSKTILLVSSHFASEDEFYQACYDVILEIMNNRPKDTNIIDCMVPIVSDACIDNLEKEAQNIQKVQCITGLNVN